MTNTDKLLNFLDEHDALHNFFAEHCWDGNMALGATPAGFIINAFIWKDSIDGYEYWKNLYDKAGEL